MSLEFGKPTAQTGGDGIAHAVVDFGMMDIPIDAALEIVAGDIVSG